jgi:hypothetical protein
MHDNKIRLSQDVLQKAELIAAEWGLKNSRAAIEAVFRRYSDDYLNGRRPVQDAGLMTSVSQFTAAFSAPTSRTGCAALDELDDLLSL